MQTVVAILAGVLVACAVYLMLSRNLVRVVMGLSLLSNAVNLVIFAAGRLSFAVPPLIAQDAHLPPEGYANPLPQALILTAIVIGFGFLSFALVLAYRAFQTLETVDTAAMRVAEPPDRKTAPVPETAPRYALEAAGRREERP